MTGLLPKEVFGQASLIVGMISLGRNVFVAPFFNAQIGLHHDFSTRGELNWFTSQITRDTWAATGAFTLFIAIVFTVIYSIDGQIRGWLLFAACALILSDTLKAIRINWFSNERFLATISSWVLLDALLSLGFAAAFAKWLQPTVPSYICGTAFGSVIATLIFGYGLFPRERSEQSKTPSITRRVLLKKVFSYGLPFVPLAIVGWMINLGDRYEVDLFLTKYDVGVYVAAYAIASRPILVGSSILGSFCRALLFRAQAEGQSAKARKIFVLWTACTFLGGLSAVIAFLIFGRFATYLLAVEYREGALRVIPWVAAGQAIFCVGQVIEMRLMSFGLTKHLILPSLIGAAVELGSGVVLIPHFGITGAAATNIFGFGSAVIVLTINLYRARRFAPSGAFVPAAG